MKNKNTEKLVLLALFSAMAYLTVFLFRIPFVPAVDFLKYEAKDVVIALAGFLFGPLSVVGISIVVSLLEMFTISSTGPVGLIMNVVASIAFSVPPALIYKKKRTLGSAAIGLAVGAVSMTITMLLWNYFITPSYMKVPREVVVSLMLPGFLPFNLVKSVLNAALTFMLYKPLVSVLRSTKLMPKNENCGGDIKTKAVVFNICAGLILIGSVVVAIILHTSGK